MEPKQQLVQPQIDLKSTTGVKCKCGGQVFNEGLILRRVSKFLSAQPKDSLLPIPLFYCVKCATPLEGMIPMEIKQDYE